MSAVTGCLLGNLLLCAWLGLAAAAPHAPAATGRIALGIAVKALTTIDVTDPGTAMSVLTVEAARRAGLHPETRIYADTRDLLADFQHGRIDLAVLPLTSYFRHEAALDGIPGVGAIRDGRRTERFLLLAGAGPEAGTVAALRHLRLAYVQRDQAGLLFLNTLLLRNQGPEMDRYFSALQVKATPAQAILAVFFRTADACVAPEHAFWAMVAQNPQVGQRLEILGESQGLMNGLAVYRKAYPAANRSRILAAAASFSGDPKGRQILTLFQLDALGQVREEDLMETRRLYQEYRRRHGRLLEREGAPGQDAVLQP